MAIRSTWQRLLPKHTHNLKGHVMITDVLKFKSIDDMRRQVTASGSEWFSPGAMQFFNTRLCDLIDGRFLITADSMDEDSPETYKVRWFTRGSTPRAQATGMLFGDHLVMPEPFAYQAHAYAAATELVLIGDDADMTIADVVTAYRAEVARRGLPNG